MHGPNMPVESGDSCCQKWFHLLAAKPVVEVLAEAHKAGYLCANCCAIANAIKHLLLRWLYLFDGSLTHVCFGRGGLQVRDLCHVDDLFDLLPKGEGDCNSRQTFYYVGRGNGERRFT
jgi:hypothetical protein